MNLIATQQVVLDNALVALKNRVRIGKCNMEIDPTKTPKLLNQEFDAPTSDKEIVTFIKELRHKGDIKSVTKVVDQMHQPWRTFATIINGCLSGKISGLDKIRLSRAQIL
ncbi:hypothetical protein Tco_0263972 [Tanacetum coccineum]